MIVADTIRPDSTQAKVRKKDSIVYETRVVKADTVYFDKRNQFVLVKLDSIVPGMYKFTSTIKLENQTGENGISYRLIFCLPIMIR